MTSAHKKLMSQPLQRCSDLRASGLDLKPFKSILFFHNSIHRYFVFTPYFALTQMTQLFSLVRVDG